MAKIKELLNKEMGIEAQKELASQIVNYSDNWLGQNRGGASVIFEICSVVLKQHLPKDEAFVKSLDNSLKCLETGDKDNTKECLKGLNNNDKKSFMILPLTTIGHLFSLVVYKENNEYKCIAVNKGGRESERDLRHHAFERYTLSEDKIEELVNNIDLNNEEISTSEFYNLLEDLAQVKEDLKRAEKMKDIDARDQIIGNCFNKEIMEAIKFAYAQAYNNFEKVRFWHNSKLVNLLVPKWPNDTKDANIEFLNCIQKNTQYQNVREFVDEITKIYSNNKDFRNGIKENATMTYEQKKELLIKSFNPKEKVDIGRLNEPAFLKECLRGVDIKTLQESLDFFMDLLEENNIKVPEILQRYMQYENFKKQLTNMMLRKEEPNKTFLGEYFPNVLENVNKNVSRRYSDHARQELKAGNLDEAMELCNKAVQNSDINIFAYAIRAEANMKLQNFEAAKEDYKKYFEMTNNTVAEYSVNLIEELQVIQQDTKELKRTIYSHNVHMEDLSEYVDKTNMLKEILGQLGLHDQANVATIEEIEVLDYVLKELKQSNNIEEYIKINRTKLGILKLDKKIEQALELCENMEQLPKDYPNNVTVKAAGTEFLSEKFKLVMDNPDKASLKQLQDTLGFVQDLFSEQDDGEKKYGTTYINIKYNIGSLLEKDGKYDLAKKEYNNAKVFAKIQNNVDLENKMDESLKRCEEMMNNIGNNLEKEANEEILYNKEDEVNRISGVYEREVERSMEGLRLKNKRSGGKEIGIYNEGIKAIKNSNNSQNKLDIFTKTLSKLNDDEKKYRLAVEAIDELDNFENKIDVFSQTILRLNDDAEKYSLGILTIDEMESFADKLDVFTKTVACLRDNGRKYGLTIRTMDRLQDIEDKLDVFARATQYLNDDERKYELATETMYRVRNTEDKLYVFNQTLSGLNHDIVKYRLGITVLDSIENADEKLWVFNQTIYKINDEEEKYRFGVGAIARMDRMEYKIKIFRETLFNIKDDERKGALAVGTVDRVDDIDDKLDIFEQTLSHLKEDEIKYWLSIEMLDRLDYSEEKMWVFGETLYRLDDDVKKYRLGMQTMDRVKSIKNKLSIFTATLSQIDDDEGKYKVGIGTIERLEIFGDKLDVFTQTLLKLNDSKAKYWLVVDTIDSLEMPEEKVVVLTEAMNNLNNTDDIYIELVKMKIEHCLDLNNKGEVLEMIGKLKDNYEELDYAFLNKIGNVLLEAGKKNEALKVYEEIFDKALKNGNNRESRRVREIVKQLSDEDNLANALTSNINKDILEKLTTVNFKAVKDEDLSKLLVRLSKVDSSLMADVKKVKSKIKQDIRKEGQDYQSQISNISKNMGKNKQKDKGMGRTM